MIDKKIYDKIEHLAKEYNYIARLFEGETICLYIEIGNLAVEYELNSPISELEITKCFGSALKDATKLRNEFNG